MDQVSVVDAISESLPDWPLATRRSLACTSIAWRDRVRRHFKDTIRVHRADCTCENGRWYADYVKRIPPGAFRVPPLVAEGSEDWKIDKNKLFGNQPKPIDQNDMDRLGETAAFFIGFLLSTECNIFHYTKVPFKIAGATWTHNELFRIRPELDYHSMTAKELALLAGSIDARVVQTFRHTADLADEPCADPCADFSFSNLLMHPSTAQWAADELRKWDDNAEAMDLSLYNTGTGDFIGILKPLLESPMPWHSVQRLSLPRIDLLAERRHRMFLAKAFEENTFPNLVHLNLSHNSLRVEGIKDLGRSIKQLKYLAHLNLEHNQLSDYAMDYVRFMMLMPSLACVDLKYNAYTLDSVEEMARFIRKNKEYLPELESVDMDVATQIREDPVRNAVQLNFWERRWNKSKRRMGSDAKLKDLDVCPCWDPL
jgi:hypothetical protein